MTALNVSKYIVAKQNRDGNPISNCRLQIVLYLVQQSALINGLQAFDDDFRAWPYGPVIPDVYYFYCGSGAMPIRYPISNDIHLERPIKKIVDKILCEIINISLWTLRNDVCKENGAWYKVKTNHLYGIINKQLIQKNICGVNYDYVPPASMKIGENMKVKLIETDDEQYDGLARLEHKINEEIKKIGPQNIIDIKYTGKGSSAPYAVDYYSAMIIYKEK